MTKEEANKRMIEYMTKHRLENKLRLWDTPGFSQFLEDLAFYIDNNEIPKFAEVLRRQYKAKLDEIEAKGKLEQIKLDL